jgi:flavin-binding protein dodecin
MPDHVYRIIQVAGSSEKSIEDAIQNAVGRSSRTLRQVGWFEVLETRGHVEDGKVARSTTTIDAETRGPSFAPDFSGRGGFAGRPLN